MGKKTQRLYWVTVGGKDGFIDSRGRIIIKPQFDVAGNFCDGRAIVGRLDPERRIDRYSNFVRQTVGVIDTLGEVVVPPQYDQIRDYSEGLAAFRSGKKWGFLDASGRVAIKAQYDVAFSFSEGLACVMKGRTSAVIDSTGKTLFTMKARGIDECHEGLMVCEVQRHWLYLGRTGATAFELKCSAASSFSEGLSKLQFLAGKLLIRSGKLAMDPNCCCGEAPCIEVSEVIASPSNRATFSFPMGLAVAAADGGSFVVNGVSGVLVSITGNNVQIEYPDEVMPGDPWTITDGSKIKFDDGSVGCDDQRGNVL